MLRSYINFTRFWNQLSSKLWLSKIHTPFEFFFSKLFFSIFLVTNHTFSTWICILHVLSFLLRYITWVLVKIFKFSFFTIEFLSITKFFLRPLTAKIIITKILLWEPFWVISMQIGYLRKHLARGGSPNPPRVTTYILDPVAKVWVRKNHTHSKIDHY